MNEKRAEIVRVLRGDMAGQMVRLLGRAGREVIVKRSNGAENLPAADVEVVEQAPPYPEILRVVPFSKRGSVAIQEANGTHVAIVSADVGHVLAAAPVLLALVEGMLPWLCEDVVTTADDGRALIDLANATLDFLRRERVECGECQGMSPTCEACAGLGVLVGAVEQK